MLWQLTSPAPHFFSLSFTSASLIWQLCVEADGWESGEGGGGWVMMMGDDDGLGGVLRISEHCVLLIVSPDSYLTLICY